MDKEIKFMKVKGGDILKKGKIINVVKGCNLSPSVTEMGSIRKRGKNEIKDPKQS